jgi:hypothetical protein
MNDRKEVATLIQELREACRRPLFEEIVLSESKCAREEPRPGDDMHSSSEQSSRTRLPPERSASSGVDISDAVSTSSVGRNRNSGKEQKANKKSWQEVSASLSCKGIGTVSESREYFLLLVRSGLVSHFVRNITQHNITATVGICRPTSLLDRRRTRAGTPIVLDSLVGILSSLFDRKRVCLTAECTT